MSNLYKTNIKYTASNISLQAILQLQQVSCLKEDFIVQYNVDKYIVCQRYWLFDFNLCNIIILFNLFFNVKISVESVVVK